MERLEPGSSSSSSSSPEGMEVDTTNPSNKRVIVNDPADSPPRKKTKPSPLLDDDDDDAVHKAGGEQTKHGVAPSAAHPPSEQTLVTIPETEQKNSCPPLGHLRVSTTTSKQTSVVTPIVPTNNTEQVTVDRSLPRHEQLVSRSKSDLPTESTSPKEPSKSQVIFQSDDGTPDFKTVTKYDVEEMQRRDYRVPPLQLASFASAESMDGSTEDSSSFVDDEIMTAGDAEIVCRRKVERSFSWRVMIQRALAALASIYLVRQYTLAPSHYSDDCTAVQGGGYSGFYYMHGVLSRNRESVMPDPSSPRDFVCYSAGCLSVVAFWSNYTGEDVVDFGKESQYRVTSGQMPWIKATERMVHNLIRGNGLTCSVVANATSGESPMQVLARTNPSFLASLNIVTTSFSKWGWPIMSVRTPTNLEELEEMLVQTSWLPFATGDWFIRGSHLDGAFTMPFHPTCPTTVGISNDWKIYFNMVNVMMDPELPRGFFWDGSQVQLKV